MRFTTLEKAFRKKYPGGSIDRYEDEADVVFQPGGKRYTYSCHLIWHLADKLGLERTYTPRKDEI